MSTRIGALEDKVSRLQVEVNRKKGSMAMEDTSEEEDEMIVGGNLEHCHNQSTSLPYEAKSKQRGTASYF